MTSHLQTHCQQLDLFKHFVKTSMLSLLMALLAGCASQSQPQQQLEVQTQNYFNSDSYKQIITATGLVYDEVYLGRTTICARGYEWQPISFGIQEPLKFETNLQHPISGKWTYRFRFERCGESITYNVQFEGLYGQPPRPLPRHPGNSRAGAQLSVDLKVPLALAAMQAGASSTCKSVRVTHTEVTVEPFDLIAGGQIFKGTWQERWTANACGQLFGADFCLMPHPKGGTNWALGACPRR